MSSSSTANDDQPGPIGWRHSFTGGDAVQSVLIRTAWTTASRSAPRKPGHRALCGDVVEPVAVVIGAEAAGSSARSRSSGVFVQRHVSCEPLLDTPSVRRSVNAAITRRMQAAIDTRLIAVERP